MASKAQRKANGSFELAETPSHLMRRCQQFYGDLYAREPGARDLTKQQFTVLCALEHNDGVSQTDLVEMTDIDRSTLAEMARRMLERGLITRKRTEEDMRANAVAITPLGRKALRSARTAAERAEKRMLDALPAAERPRLVKLLSAIATDADNFDVSDSTPQRRKLPRRPHA
jgi:DNA-binding MarR family transcriptional regulator